jgi:hypothetical protein
MFVAYPAGDGIGPGFETARRQVPSRLGPLSIFRVRGGDLERCIRELERA